MPEQPLLEITNLKTHFATEAGAARAVDGVSFSLFPNQTLAIVGEGFRDAIDPRLNKIE